MLFAIARERSFFMFSKFVGVCYSNKAEVLTILEALQCFLKNFHGDVSLWRVIHLMQLLGYLIIKATDGNFNSPLMKFNFSYYHKCCISSLAKLG